MQRFAHEIAHMAISEGKFTVNGLVYARYVARLLYKYGYSFDTEIEDEHIVHFKDVKERGSQLSVSINQDEQMKLF